MRETMRKNRGARGLALLAATVASSLACREIVDFPDPPAVRHARTPSNQHVHATARVLHHGPASMGGDSGAGIFAQQSYDASAACGAPRVVAVLSAGRKGEDGQPDATVGVRVGRFADFLRAGAETAAQFGNYEKPKWAE